MDQFFQRKTENLEEAIEKITDPSDFTCTRFPPLKDLDTLLRCHICKDFLNNPVLTSCGHTFCSICIRRYLQQEFKCPLCLKELRESGLSKNILLEEVVRFYTDARESLLVTLAKPVEQSLPRKEPIEVEDDDLVEISPPKKRARNEAACPVCNKYFPIETLQTTHIDTCLSESSLGSKSASYFNNQTNSETLSKLPKIDTTMSLKELKQKLGEHKLNTVGDRNRLIERYNQFVLLWNSNLDSNHVQSVSEVRKKLHAWELGLKSSLATKLSDVEPEKWKKQNSGHFRDLLMMARKSRK